MLTFPSKSLGQTKSKTLLSNYGSIERTSLVAALTTNSILNVGNPTKLTISFWLYLIVPGQVNNGIITRSGLSSSQGDWAVGFFNGSSMRLTFRVNNNGGAAQSATTLVVSTWYFIECNFDSSLANNNIKIFINGVLDTQATYTTAITNVNSPIVIGTYFDLTHCFGGYLGEFEFCNSIARHNANYPVPDTINRDGFTTVLWKAAPF